MFLRTITWLIIGLCWVFVASCVEEQTNATELLKADTKQIQVDSIAIREAERLEKRKIMLEQQRLDSLEMERVLSEVLSQLKPATFHSRFKDSLTMDHDDLGKIYIEMEYDFLLNRKQKNLRIRRFSQGLVQIDLFSLKNGKPSQILDYQIWDLTHINDTLQDVNGDGLNDLVVNGYGSTGCCLKAFSEVFLVKKDLESFSPMFHFINPTFSGHEGVVRGVCYGHLGETELYKFRWHNHGIDTVEYIAFERSENGKRTGNMIVSNQYPEHKNYRILRTVPTIPAEYLNIEGFDWFANEFLKE